MQICRLCISILIWAFSITPPFTDSGRCCKKNKFTASIYVLSFSQNIAVYQAHTGAQRADQLPPTSSCLASRPTYIMWVENRAAQWSVESIFKSRCGLKNLVDEIMSRFANSAAQLVWIYNLGLFCRSSMVAGHGVRLCELRPRLVWYIVGFVGNFTVFPAVKEFRISARVRFNVPPNTP